MITFHVKGTSLDAFRSAGVPTHGKALGNPAVEACALPGAFGGSVINLTGANGIAYLAQNNLPAGAITILLRFAPTTTGGAAGSILNINNGYGAWCGGIRITQGSGILNLLFRNTNANIVYNDTISSSPGYVADQFMDLWIVWDGTQGAGKIKLYLAQHGNAATLVSSVNADYANSRDTIVSGSVMIGADPFINGMAALLNEFVMWDEAIDPTTFGVRADFIPSTALNGSLNAGAGAENIRSGVSETINGVVIAGTATIPSLANTKIGVAGDGGTGTYDGTDRHTHPIAAEVANGVSFKNNSLTNNVTGTLDNVTNVIGNHALAGQELDGILEAN